MFQDAVRQNTTEEDEEEVAEVVLFLMFCTYSDVCVIHIILLVLL